MVTVTLAVNILQFTSTGYCLTRPTANKTLIPILSSRPYPLPACRQQEAAAGLGLTVTGGPLPRVPTEGSSEDEEDDEMPELEVASDEEESE